MPKLPNKNLDSTVAVLTKLKVVSKGPQPAHRPQHIIPLPYHPTTIPPLATCLHTPHLTPPHHTTENAKTTPNEGDKRSRKKTDHGEETRIAPEDSMNLDEQFEKVDDSWSSPRESGDINTPVGNNLKRDGTLATP